MALIELLVASLILGIAVVGLSTMFAQGMAMTASQGDDRVAISLAQQRIEELRAIALVSVTCVPLASNPGSIGQLMGPNAGCPATLQLVYNEQIARDPASNLLVYAPTAQPQYTRTTVVQCADPASTPNTFAPIACPATLVALRLTVTVTPQSPQARPVTIDSVLTSH
jgi:hypothetical protein